jgi:hypothetical protein
VRVTEAIATTAQSHHLTGLHNSERRSNDFTKGLFDVGVKLYASEARVNGGMLPEPRQRPCDPDPRRSKIPLYIDRDIASISVGLASKSAAVGLLALVPLTILFGLFGFGGGSLLPEPETNGEFED